MKIHTKDTVIILAGKDKGKTGKVIAVKPTESKIVVEKVNIAKIHRKPTQSSPKGGIQEIERAFPASKAMLVCPHCSKPTRMAHKVENGKKYRICNKCHQVID